MHQLVFDNYNIHYSILRQKRNTMQLKLLDPQHLQVIAPPNLTEDTIKQFLYSKQKWIATRVQHLTKLNANPVNKNIANGAQIMLLGHPHTILLQMDTTSQPTVHLKNATLVITLPNTDSNSALALTEWSLKKWYVEYSAQILAKQTTYWAKKIGVTPASITIKDQKTRWGSCSSLGHIYYNWRIIMAPAPVIDYLVVHELCHLSQPNHSAAFWHLVNLYLPDFKQHRRWLRDNSLLLSSIL